MVKKWRAHTQSINSIIFIENSQTIISGSVDCTVRIWSNNGYYIGTFGQKEIWNIFDIKTYKFPKNPEDIAFQNLNYKIDDDKFLGNISKEVCDFQTTSDKKILEVYIFKIFLLIKTFIFLFLKNFIKFFKYYYLNLQFFIIYLIKIYFLF